jgi:hypothetical protein
MTADAYGCRAAEPFRDSAAIQAVPVNVDMSDLISRSVKGLFR